MKTYLMVVVFMLTTFHVAAETPFENKSARAEILNEEASVEATGRVISVRKEAADSSVATRISNILISSKKFNNLELQVKDGLVFLEGIALDEKYIDWAGDIAKNTEGVVAVINNLTAQNVDYFTIDPIKNEFYKLYFKFLEVVPLVLIGFIVFTTFFFLSKPVSRWLSRPVSYITSSLLIQNVVKRFITIFLMLIGLYFFLKIAGLTQFALAVISGTGVIGLVLGFAFRDIAENFISSLLISVQRPFHLGDVIEVSGHKGVVRKVTARGTTLVDFDGNHIQIPNAIIYKNIIQNFSANPFIRGHFILGIGYDSSIKQAQELALTLMLNHSAVIEDPEPQVLVDTLGSSTVNLKILFWVNGHEFSVVKVASILMRQVIREFEDNGISMPDDAREIIFPNGVPIQQMSHDTSAREKSKTQANSSGSSEKETSNHEHKARDKTVDKHELSDDLSADTNDIKQQASQSRDPEEGSNII